MKRVLIVEDEPLEREALAERARALLPAKAQVISTDNGIEALRLCQRHQPEVVLLDINIPGISGLTLVETLNSFAFSGKIIITTAYDLFSYIRKAMNLGVVDYLLKPIRERELAEALCRCRERLNKERSDTSLQERLSFGIASACSYAEAYLARDLLQGNVPDNALQNAFFWPPDGMLQARLLRWRKAIPTGGEPQAQQSMDDHVQNLVLRLIGDVFGPEYRMLRTAFEGDALALLQPQKPQDPAYLDASLYACCLALQDRLEAEGVGRGRLGAAPLRGRYAALPEDGRQLCARLERPGPEALILPPMDMRALCAPRERHRLRQKWLQHLREGHTPYILAMLKRAMAKPGAYWPGAVLFIEAVRKLDPSAAPDTLARLFCEERPYQAVGEWLDARVSRPLHGCAAEQANHHAAIAKAAMAILADRFCEDLSQAAIAEEFGLSQPYFSRLFKRETGESFIATLTRLRMQHAKRLLREEGLTVRDVARQCGYSNGKYFLEAFKREVGCTPAQYQRGANAGDRRS